MSLIKMITQGLLGGIDEGGGGGGLLSQKPSNGGLPKWNSGMDEKHPDMRPGGIIKPKGAVDSINPAALKQPNHPMNFSGTNLVERGIISEPPAPAGSNMTVDWLTGITDQISVINEQFNSMKKGVERFPTNVQDTAKIQALTKSPSLEALSVSNNNPGNIKDFGTAWDGMVGAPKTDGSFLQFNSPEMGVRALTKDLTTKMGRGLNNIGGILNVYAPPSENDTQSYIDSVVQSTGIAADQTLTDKDLMSVIRAMIKHEGGSDSLKKYTDQIIGKGMNLAYPDIYN